MNKLQLTGKKLDQVFNKTVKNYLASFVDDTTLDWENFLPALMLSYNTSYHSTIATNIMLAITTTVK